MPTETRLGACRRSASGRLPELARAGSLLVESASLLRDHETPGLHALSRLDPIVFRVNLRALQERQPW